MNAIDRHCRDCRAIPGAPCRQMAAGVDHGRMLKHPHCGRTIVYHFGDHPGWTIAPDAGYRAAYEAAVLELVGTVQTELLA